MTLQQALEELRLSKEDHVIPGSKIGLKDHQVITAPNAVHD